MDSGPRPCAPPLRRYRTTWQKRLRPWTKCTWTITPTATQTAALKVEIRTRSTESDFTANIYTTYIFIKKLRANFWYCDFSVLPQIDYGFTRSDNFPPRTGRVREKRRRPFRIEGSVPHWGASSVCLLLMSYIGLIFSNPPPSRFTVVALWTKKKMMNIISIVNKMSWLKLYTNSWRPIWTLNSNTIHCYVRESVFCYGYIYLCVI